MSDSRQSSQGYSPPVDSDGFQCGVCLMLGRQCAACADEVEEEERLEALADNDPDDYVWGFDRADDAAYFNAADYERVS